MVLYRRGDRALRPLTPGPRPQKVDSPNIPFVNPPVFHIPLFFTHFSII